MYLRILKVKRLFLSYVFAGHHCSQYERSQKSFDASQQSKKRERNRTIILNEPGKYFIFLRLQKCFDVSQGSTKESLSNFGLTWEIFHIISLKESLMKWNTTRIATFLGYLVRSRKQFHGPHKHSFSAFF